MKRAITTVAFLCAVSASEPGRATADDAVGASVTDQAKGAVSSAAEQAKDTASRATEAASEQASELAERASKGAQEATEAAKARAKQAADKGAGMVDSLRASAQRTLDAAGSYVARFFGRFEGLGAEALQRMRDGTRAKLVSAANALDEYSAKARRNARLDRWEDLKKRFNFVGEQPSPAVSEELRAHEFRVARIKRAREIAEAAGDARSVKRSDNLLESEYARSHDRLATLREEEHAQHSQLTEEGDP